MPNQFGDCRLGQSGARAGANYSKIINREGKNSNEFKISAQGAVGRRVRARARTLASPRPRAHELESGPRARPLTGSRRPLTSDGVICMPGERRARTAPNGAGRRSMIMLLGGRGESSVSSCEWARAINLINGSYLFILRSLASHKRSVRANWQRAHHHLLMF